MMQGWIIIGFLVLAAAVTLFFVWMLTRRRRLSSAARVRVQGILRHAATLQDPSARVLEADKALDALLGALGYRGSLGNKLKAASSRLQHIDALWRVHKLRNRLAHEAGARASVREAEHAITVIQAAVDSVS